MSRDDIERFFDKHYRPANLVFAAAGALRHEDIVDAVAQRWHGRSGGDRPVRSAPQPRLGGQSIHSRPTDQAHVVVGFPAPDRHDPRRYAASLLDVMLGGGMASRLFQEVREKRGLAYSVYSSFAPYHDAGEMSVYVGTAPARLSEALPLVLAEVGKAGNGDISEMELARAKRHLRATTALGLEDSSARMSRIGRSLLLHGDVLTVDEVNARVEAVTLEEIHEVAGTMFAVEPTIAAVGPIEEEDLYGKAGEL